MNSDSKDILLIFDWGNTIMRDLGLPGVMKDWPVVEWIPHVDMALPVLNSRFTLCIATSAEHSGTDDMISALARLGAQKYFHLFFSSFDLQTRKPDPGFFKRIIELTGYKASHCLSIGDKYEKDIAPAKSLGIRTIFFNESNEPGDFPAADRVIQSMDMLVALIDELITD